MSEEAPLHGDDRLSQDASDLAQKLIAELKVHKSPDLSPALKIIEICKKSTFSRAEPIRMIRHLSCSGGTLIAKCLASMKNVIVLNEIAPHSPILTTQSGKASFTPTDIIALAKQGDQKTSIDIVSDLFLKSMESLHQQQTDIGRSLILREHSHSYYLFGEIEENTPKLETLLENIAPVLAVTTVRHPVDSYLSMKKQNWHTHFEPSNFEAYCERYLAFLDAGDKQNIYKYEDFLEDPNTIMHSMCEDLDISFNPNFQSIFHIFNFSGDSGRGGQEITKHSRQKPEPEFLNELKEMPVYQRLITRLNYDFW